MELDNLGQTSIPAKVQDGIKLSRSSCSLSLALERQKHLSNMHYASSVIKIVVTGYFKTTSGPFVDIADPQSVNRKCKLFI